MQGTLLELPTGYYVERDPDILILRRLDGSMVGAFSARGAAPEDVRRAVEETAQKLPEESRRAPSGPQLRARFFGRFEVLCGGETLHLGRNGKALTILKYLLANRTRLVSQDHLMGWLWPESNLKKARWSLNSAIHTLRKLLSGCISSPSASGYVVLEEGHYRLCPTIRLSTDVDDFDNCYEEGRRQQREGRLHQAASEYERAIELYEGDYLVEDLYEDWTMVERERLANAYLNMLGWLALYYAEAGYHQQSIEACYRILEKDRCHEDSYRLLMRSYVRLGLRARALHQYRLCERILGQEYGTTPSPETQSLYGSLVGDEAI
ncbi:MAG TPA: BTAD domain-containing putative transcriptional regulator [Rubrobacteraceae bacterium]|nr:BTAD domain-containing putative transcriptional regulator [Rubrobacteraceae bacterium]